MTEGASCFETGASVDPGVYCSDYKLKQLVNLTVHAQMILIVIEKVSYSERNMQGDPVNFYELH